MKQNIFKNVLPYSPSMTHLLLSSSNWQSAPLHGCSCGTQGSPFHPRRRGRPSALFSACKALTMEKGGVIKLFIKF